MVTNALEEMALSYHRNTEEQNEICDKHKIPLIKILRTNDILCRLCEYERIHAENQIRVNELSDAEYERERKFYLEKFSLYDDVLKNATLENFDTPTEKEVQKLEFAKKSVKSGQTVPEIMSFSKAKLEQVRAILHLRL